ncbi:TPA: hypothetical protein EYP66_08835, partial [Candidatus Poribacteria bacterium]|nr:hypothetical protein [Candidatus Poribacteria bacterium]
MRIIAATNADIEQLMRQGKFRDDLYDRLAFETIWMSPLHERKEDIERVTYKTDTTTIFPHHLPGEILTKCSTIDIPGKPLKEKLDNFEKQLLIDALEQNDLPRRAAPKLGSSAIS